MDSEDDCVFVCPSAAHSRSPPAVSSEAKYTYTPLKALKPRTLVNVYGVVTFFKQPFPTKGSDYCSTLKITDQSDAKVCCTIFAKNLEDHPVIFQVGDIIRLHRFKTDKYKDAMTLLNTFGWSIVTFDGKLNSQVVPRTSSKSFHFDESDKRTVQELRRWAADQSLVSSEPTVPLSSVHPLMFFDLTCQLLAKAVMDSRCILLKVWDGTKCEHPLLKVAVAPDTEEGESTVAKDRMNLTANVLVYDNHIDVAQSLKPGMFLRIYNLHAMMQKIPNQTDQSEQLSFHLHGGTAYGRGLRSLPADSPELQSLKRLLENHVDLEESDEVNDGTLLEMWYTPPESVVVPNDEEPDGEADMGTSLTVRTCAHTLQCITLAQVKCSTPPLVCHVRAQVKTYQPRQLYQSLKLFCSRCKTMRNVPDDTTIKKLLEESARVDQPCHEPWAATSSTSFNNSGRSISMHISSDMVGESTHSQLIFVQGMTLNELCLLSRAYKNLVPVRSDNGRMNLIDLNAPFLFCGDKRFYGCKQCSPNTFERPVFTGVDNWDEQTVANALGVQLMQYELLIQFELEDGTDRLEALLWENADKFFHVSAVDASASQDFQDKVQTIMDTLKPPETVTDEHPWLDLCLSVYTVEDSGRNRVCYQITDTETREDL